MGPESNVVVDAVDGLDGRRKNRFGDVRRDRREDDNTNVLWLSSPDSKGAICLADVCDNEFVVSGVFLPW